MTTTLRWAVLIAAVGGLSGCCNPLLALAESATFGSTARTALAETCCECLLTVTIDTDDGCVVPAPDDDDDAGAAAADDGGVAVDAGAAAEDEDAGPRPRSPCLCEAIDEATCTARLLEKIDEPLLVVGACVRRDLGHEGPCNSACGGVLIYPEDTAESP